ncbi:NitT/TauT family transport system ATP-binding protein [Variovorax paradoxus]|uniref:ABC transporter ATP-binding protein n=1 Tax=Variovorax atrisoli TaxID=3394203 RepID=UPI00119AADC8|nr:ABC transporter ATP-binding protein [Variovorax paradoxus]MDR6521532.1 NitT/TauT family transport system ATP-binding protein [Variovorax paradoxus]
MAQAFIQLSDVMLRYGGGTIALDHTTLDIDKGDFVALVGPSGCGKSTILKLVAGLLRPSAGAVIAGGREVGATGVQPPAGNHASAAPRLRIGLAFQNPTMLPWLTVRENVMVPLKIVDPFRQDYRRKKKGEYAERADALLAQVGLRGFGDRRPWQLSGGMLQRASLCRALVHEPELLLLDEPFGALDQFTREELWDIMQKLWIERRPTVLLVTHDLRESAYLANRICVMSARPGRILETREVGFARPRTLESSYAPEFAALVQQLRMRIAQARGGDGGVDGAAMNETVARASLPVAEVAA